MKKHNSPAKKTYPFFVTILSILLFTAATAQPVISFQSVPVSGQSAVVDIVQAGDGTNRIFLVQQTGTIRVYDAGFNLLNSNFLTISSNITTGGERGLLSLAFHPSFETNRYFFVYYTNAQGGINIDRFQTQVADPNQADISTRTNILTVPKPVAFTNHNGGDLNFGPDGHLYAGLGDAGSGGDPRNYAQRGDSLWGKMIRINVDNFTTPPFYTIPADNPYIADPNILDEIWALGLRNPWRWSFDRLTGDMWIGDVGQGNREEINYRPAGATGGINYGWRCYEGLAAYNTSGCAPQNTYISPIFDYPHVFATGGFSVTGGYVYRGTEFPVLNGYYICSDYVTGNAWLIQSNGAGGWNVRQQSGLPSNISCFGETEDGTLYAASLGGTVYKIVVTGVLPVRLERFTVQTAGAGFNEISWKTAAENNLDKFTVEYSTDGTRFQPAGNTPATNQASGHTYRFIHAVPSQRQKMYYRLVMNDLDGHRDYSAIVILDPATSNPVKVWPTLVKNGELQLQLSSSVTQLTLTSGSGQQVMQKTIAPGTGYMRMTLPPLAAGYYIVTLQGKEKAAEHFRIYVTSGR